MESKLTKTERIYFITSIILSGLLVIDITWNIMCRYHDHKNGIKTVNGVTINQQKTAGTVV